MSANENYNLGDPEQRHAYVIKQSLAYEREQKAKSPFAHLPDLGIALTPEEERECRDFAAELGISYQEVADYVAATEIVVDIDPNSKFYLPLGKARVLPRKLLRITIKGLLYQRALRRDKGLSKY